MVQKVTDPGSGSAKLDGTYHQLLVRRISGVRSRLTCLKSKKINKVNVKRLLLKLKIGEQHNNQ
jgi:hypothetical protein